LPYVRDGCGRTPIKARHLGVRGGLVDEDDSGRIEIELAFKPRLARRVQPAAALFGGVRRLFFAGDLTTLQNRQSVPMAAVTPRRSAPCDPLRRRITLVRDDRRTAGSVRLAKRRVCEVIDALRAGRREPVPAETQPRCLVPAFAGAG
jgi:hypothetical protein